MIVHVRELLRDGRVLVPFFRSISPSALPFKRRPRIAKLDETLSTDAPRASSPTHGDDGEQVTGHQAGGFVFALAIFSHPRHGDQGLDAVVLGQDVEQFIAHDVFLDFFVIDAILLTAVTGLTDKLHVVSPPRAFDVRALLEQEDVIARERVRGPRAEPAVQRGVAPHKLSHRLLHDQRPKLVVVRLHKYRILRPLVTRNEIVHRHGDPPLLLAVVKPHAILAAKRLFPVQYQPFDRSRVFRQARQRAHQPTIPELALHAVPRFDDSLIQHHRLVLAPRAQVADARPIAPAKFAIHPERRVARPDLILVPKAFQQATAQRSHRAARAQPRVRAEARRQIRIDRVPREDERRDERRDRGVPVPGAVRRRARFLRLDVARGRARGRHGARRRDARPFVRGRSTRASPQRRV